MKMTAEQDEALKLFADFIYDDEAQYMVIQGDSGTGKSTLIQEMIHNMRSDAKLRALLMQTDDNLPAYTPVITATTNKAAAALSDITGDEVVTIHSFLGLTIKPNFSNGEEDLVLGKSAGIVMNKLIIVDEASFISRNLFNFISELTLNCKIILIGDQYQLAPVKQKVPIMSRIASNYKANLTQIMRHKNHIATLGKQFKNAVMTNIFAPIATNGREVIHVDGPTFKSMISDSFGSPDYVPSDARVLTWTNNKVNEYNTFIRDIKGYPAMLQEGEYALTNKPCAVETYRNRIVADSVVCLVRVGDYAMSEGIEGREVSVHASHPNYFQFMPNSQMDVKRKMSELRKMKDWSTYFKIKKDWLDLRPLYASTIHKSQGSEYKKVFINLEDVGRCTISSDAARLLYVSITRATEQVILYGSLPARYGGTPEEL